MNELALFSGAAGGILGGKLLGWRTVCAVEIDGHRRDCIIARQNEGALEPFPIWDNICTFDGLQWRGRVDVVSGGFPCQAYSTAARGRNVADDLWPEMRRVVAEVAPRYVFAENVSRRAIDAAADGWVTKPDAFPCPRRTWVVTTFGHGIGFVHTPTTKANYAAISMQKWPGCRAYVRAFGRPSPGVEEWLMGWPDGWSDTQPLATGKFQSWLQRHGACSASS